MKVRIDSKFSQVLSYETYPPAPEIEGVWTHQLRKNRSENGAFMEYARLGTEGLEGTPGHLIPRQISVSWAAPGRINAFHIHVKEVQNEVWCVIQGQLMVWLIDCRANSSTLGVHRKLVLSGEQPTMVYIPSGVAHGYQAAETGATLLYSMDAQFNLSDPNEGRMPWDTFGEDIWAPDRG